MKALKLIVISLYRLWFYLLLGIPILLMLPVLLFSIISTKTYPLFYACARIWAKMILYGMGFFPRIKRDQKMQKGKSYMLVANHTSMTDIMLMLAVSRQPFVFVGKKELTRIPLFGYFYRKTCILVDRKNAESRLAVYDEAKKKLGYGYSICIFPEGGVPDDYEVLLDRFKDGAFRLAIEHQIPIVPVTFYDNKRRLPYKFDIASPGKMRARMHDFIETTGLRNAEDRSRLRESTRNLIKEKLRHPDQSWGKK